MSIDTRTCFTYAYSNGTYTDYIQTGFNAGDQASTNILDLDVAGIRIAGSKPPWLVVQVAVVFDNLTSLEIALETDSDSGFATTRRQICIWNVALANLDAIGDLPVNQPLPHYDYQRYMRLYFNVVGSNPSATAGLVARLAQGPEPAVTDRDLVGL